MTTLISSIITFPLTQPVAIFLLVLGIILITPIIFARMKIPYIVGMIIAGVVVGPYGLNLLARDASFEIFGQVGILYLMFLASVEIDMYNLRKNYRKGVVFGLLTFAIPMAAGIFLSRWAFGCGWTTGVLIASMYASHTLISYPVVNRFGLSNRRGVVISICGTIVAVMLALVALAQVVDVSVNGSVLWSHVWQLFILTAIYALSVGYTFPWVTKWFFRHFSDSISQFIFILAMVFVASLLSQLIGLEAILGAFYAGLVLNRFIPSRSALMNRIEFVGNAIFIPYFLIGVGMLINVHVIFRGWGVVWVMVNMVAVALSSKWVAAWLTQKIFHLSSGDRRLMFGLSSGKAAATIVATMVGYQYGLLSEDMLNGAVLMILICSGVASLVTERAAINMREQIAGESLRKEPHDERRNARQIVAVANPITAEGLMKLAILLRHPQNRVPMTALFVRNNDDPGITAMGRNALRTALSAAAAVDIKVNDTERYDLNIVSGLRNVIKEQDATDVIIGLHRKSNIVDTFYGALIEQLLASTNKMIIMSRCFVPVDTLSRLVIIVPRKAEYETGFRLWVERVGNLATQLGSRAIFIAYKESISYIQGILMADGYNIRHEYREMESWDDFIMLSNRIADEDLMIVIGARRTSISFTSDLEQIPEFLSRYFSTHNLLVVYPEQFGGAVELPAPIDPLAQSISTSVSSSWFSLTRLRRLFKAILWKRHHNNHTIDL